MMRRLLAAGLVACVAALWLPLRLGAHAELLRTDPAAGIVLPTPPSQVQLWFSEPVDPPADAVVIVGPDGVRADGHDSAAAPGDEGSLRVSLRGQLQGTYVVRWRAISADSHPINGEFQFSVGRPTDAASAPQPLDAPPATDGVPLQAAARWLHLLALALVIGPLALILLVVDAADLAELAPGLWRGARLGAVVLIPAALFSLVAQSTAVAGSIAPALRPDALVALLHTRWGVLWVWRAALAVLAAVATILSTQRLKRTRLPRLWIGATLVPCAGLVALTALNSHSAATTPVWLSLGVDAVHITATTVWIGGLFAMVAILLPALRPLDAARHQRLGPIVSRFSVVALVSVEVLVLTGLYHAWAHVSDPAALTSTAYGRTLLVKLLLIAAMLLPAAFNLLVARPRLVPGGASARDVPRPFTQALRIEAGLGVLVLGSVGLLTSLPPAQSAPAAQPAVAAHAVNEPSVTMAAPAGRFLVTLTAGPGRVGSNRVSARVQDQAGLSVNNAQVRFRIVPPDASQITPWVVVPAVDGAERRATVDLAPEGRWRVEVTVAEGAQPLSPASFAWSIPMRGAGELLAAAAERMNRLHSVTENVEMTMSGVPSADHFDYQAPDRQRRVGRDGTAVDVQVGGVRYVRQGARWVEAMAPTPLRWPDYRWLESATDVVLIGRESLDDQECFVVGYVDTRDGSRVRLWIAAATLRVVRRESAIPGHVHISRFSQFDAVPPIQLPPASTISRP